MTFPAPAPGTWEAEGAARDGPRFRPGRCDTGEVDPLRGSCLPSQRAVQPRSMVQTAPVTADASSEQR